MTRVLIVDDKEENLYYLEALLTGHGCSVESVRHGAEALVKARQNPPDLVVSDLLMPVMDGYTLLRHWKSDTRLKGIPFIVYTATYTEEEDERLAISLGADAFILKPAEPEDFLRRLREVQSNATAAAPASPRRQVGDEHALLKVYSEALIRKLEEKTLQLEETNRTLQNDIAERRRAEENLRESEERFRATFEQAAVGIAHVGSDGRFLRVNDKLCEITGYPRDELLRVTFRSLTNPEDQAEGDGARRAMLEGKSTAYTTEKRYRRKDGNLIWCSVVTTLLRDAAGAPKYFITVIADITERKTLEAQFLRAQRMESIGTLAGGIAHDLNNLLSPIVMGVELLKPAVADEIHRKVLETMEHSARRGTDLVRQVLSFARGVEGARVAVHIGHILREVESITLNTFPRSISFRSKVEAGLWLVQGDPTQLNQVLLNLCVNARDAMPEGGTLILEARNVTIDESHAAMNRTIPAGRYVAIDVIDTGSGIPRDVVDRIFEPFFTTKEPGKGTGLGLSTALGIVRNHGGVVTVESESGKGSTFRVYLPAQADSAATVADSEIPAERPRGQGELILVVEDDASVLSITTQTLRTYGYEVLTAEDGAQAMGLYALHRDRIAAVLADIMMPVMDGVALITALRRVNPEARIIATSGLHGNAAKAISAGAQHFLMKPYNGEAILGTLHRLLHEKT